MKKFSTEEITNIISSETNIWEQFKQNMKRWEKKLEVYGINIKLEQYWENNIYNPDEIFNERVEFRAGYQYYCSFVLLKDGKEIDSVAFSKHIEECMIKGKSTITFVIGGSLGLGKSLLQRADYRLCFSKMTFPHQLMKLILVEQVYRAFKIMNNQTYHK